MLKFYAVIFATFFITVAIAWVLSSQKERRLSSAPSRLTQEDLEFANQFFPTTVVDPYAQEAYKAASDALAGGTGPTPHMVYANGKTLHRYYKYQFRLRGRVYVGRSRNYRERVHRKRQKRPAW